MPFKPGDIVTDVDDESMLEGQQGEVVLCQLCFWEDPEVTVRFDTIVSSTWLDFLTEEDQPPDDVYELYPPSKLRLDQDWRPEVCATRLFGKNWREISTLKEPLDPEKPCMVNDCPCKQTQTIWVSIWGSVYNGHVCDEHAKHYRHYSCMDSLPWRPLEEAS